MALCFGVGMRKVSEIDIINLEIIRHGVTDSIRTGARLLDNYGVDVLDVAPQVWHGAKEYFIKSHVDTLDIDVDSGATYIADITRNNSEIIADCKYDVVVMTEVLEHTLNPFLAVDEVYRILKPSGALIMTTPFNFRIHNPLPDCWRFTEHGLRELLKKFTEINIQENGTDRFLFPVQYKVLAYK